MKSLHAILSLLMLSLISCAAQQPISDPVARRKALDLVAGGVKALHLSDLHSAEANFQLALEIHRLPEALDGLACVYLLSERLRSSRIMFRRVIEEFPNYGRAYANLALLEERAGNFSRARKLYRKSLDINPDDYQARNNFAVHLIEGPRGSLDEAKFELEKARAVAKHKILERNWYQLEER